MAIENSVIIVAGGRGTRFGGPLPKQFLELAGRPVLMRTIEAFASAGISGLEIVVVLPPDQHGLWRDLCRKHGFEVPHVVASGGASRFESVRNGLRVAQAPGEGVIAVHDGVRPLASQAMIGRVMHVAQHSGAAIPVVPVTDSVRRLGPDGASHSVPRSQLRAVQTPQAFNAALLRQAYRVEPSDAFTDDASVVEAAGHTVTLVEGEPSNIKITHPADIAVAEILMSNARS